MTSLPPALLEQLLAELSTLASVYHKPPESFVGKGRYGADAIQRAAILEQREDAAENPIAASAVAAAATGTAPQNNIENLLDIDFDGGAPASLEQQSATATPDRALSPAGGAQPGGGMADMMGLFDAPPPPASGGGGGANDLMNGFEGLDLSGSSAPPPAAQQLDQGAGQSKQDSDDLLGLF
jgi:AP-1 complex subunit beta-1